jgi:hypothetical protein
VDQSAVVVGFVLECRATATVRVSVVTTGTNRDPEYWLVHQIGCDDYYYTCPGQPLPAQGSVEFITLTGPETFRLEDVANNCIVVAPGNPATITATEDVIAELRFEVACQ